MTTKIIENAEGSQGCPDEWQLPGKMRALMSRLHAELIEPTRSKIKVAEQNRSAELARAKVRLSQGEALFRGKVKQAEKELEKAKVEFTDVMGRLVATSSTVKLEIDGIQEKLISLINESVAHIQSQGVSLRSASLHHSRDAGSTQKPQSVNSYIHFAKKQLNEAMRQCGTLRRTNMPSIILWKQHPWLDLCALTVSFGIAWPLSTAVNSTPVLFMFAGLFYLAFRTVYKNKHRAALIKSLYSLKDVCDNVEELLAKGLSKANDDYQRESAAAEMLYIDNASAQCKKECTDANDNILIPAKNEYEQATKNAESTHAAKMRVIKMETTALAERFHNEFDTFRTQTGFAGADWTSPSWADWVPDASPDFAARFGTLTAKVEDLKNLFPEINWAFSLPALIPFATGSCFLLKATGKGKDKAADALQSASIRIIANTPPGKFRFTLIDPVGLGHNVADFMHLGDVNPELISGKAWTEPQHIEQQLTKITEDMETVIQTFLRKKFHSIQDYNKEHNEVAEPYRFLLVFDFPVNFTESSARRLISIIKNGPRCGVFTLILQDTAKAMPYGFNAKDLEDAATRISMRDDGRGNCEFAWEDPDFNNLVLSVDGLPPQNESRAIIKMSGELAAKGMKKEVPFEKLVEATQKKDSWLVSSTSRGLQVPIGTAGKGSPQELIMGGGQEAHALMVGRTGSGKTNLMHVIITNLALTYSPFELQLYLIDFKGGVGFNRYAEHLLPHARVIAIESEREFGMSVLRGLDSELKQRSEAFRGAGVDNLAAYRANTKNELPMPRILLVVDEFQEFFADKDDAALQAIGIFERLARQGRSYGIHFLLATQSMQGSGQLPASITGQIKVRIALACNDVDSRLILADDNKAARSLSQAGEAIYNPMGGLVEGNNKFQVAHFNEDIDLQKYLGKVTDMARGQQITATPIIFEGSELARAEDSAPLKALIATSDWPLAAKSIDIFLGEPIAILPPVAARLRRQSGSNVMILTREESEGVGICVSALLSILVQQPATSRRIYIADFSTADSEWAAYSEAIARNFPGEITVLKRQKETNAIIDTIAKEVRSREEEYSGGDKIFLVLQGMHRIRSLRENMDDEEGKNPVELLQTILRDGPEVDVHVIAWADTYANTTRGLSRKSIGEFGLRVGAAMSTDESMSFFDNLAASKISKPHRAIFADEDLPGQLVTFRPYAIPKLDWLSQIGQRLRTRSDAQRI